MAVKKRNRRRQPKRKSARANKKLLTIIGLIAALSFVGAGAAWYLLEYRGAQRNISIGDGLVAEGNFRDAEKQYGRALTKDPANLEFVAKWRDTLTLITPATPTEADAFYKKYLLSLQHVARYNPLDIDAQLRVIEELYRSAYVTSKDGYWNQVLFSTQTSLERISPSDPRRHELLLYNALATLHIDHESMTDAHDDDGMIRFPGENLIEEVLEDDPSNAVAWAALAHGRMAVYHRLINQGRTQQAARSRSFADKTLIDAIEIASGGLDIAETQLRETLLRRVELLQRIDSEPSPSERKELDAIESLILDARDRAITAYDPKEQYYRTGQLVGLVLQTGKDAREVATSILKAHAKENPNDTGRKFQLAMLLRRQGLYNEASEIAQSILETPQLQVSLFAIQQFLVRPQAAQLLVLLSTDQFSNSEGEEREAFLADAMMHREVLADLVSQKADDPLLMYANGVIAIAENRFTKAALLLEELILQNPQVSTQVYREAAFALAQSGAIGLARERLAVALEREQGLLANYILKARIELMISDYEAAAVTLNQLSAEARELPEIQQLLDLIALNQKEDETRFTDPVLAMIAISERATALGEFDDAKTILSDGISQISTPDWRLFAAMSNVYIALQDMKEAAVWMKKAIEEEPDNQILQNTLLVLESDDEVAASIAIVEAMDLGSAEKAELIAVRLFTKAMNKFAESERLANIGNETEAEEAKSIGDRALAESDRYQSEAEAAGSDMTKITIIRFEQSIVDLEIETASGLVEKLSTLTDDKLIIDGSRVRLLLAKAAIATSNKDSAGFELHSNKAIEIAKNMTSEVPFSDHAWNMLGLAYSAVGQHAEALPAFEEAWRIAPNNKENVRKYIASLTVTNSEPQRRLRVVRLARDRFPNDRHFLALWLRTEQATGDKWKVIEYHSEKYKIHPDDTQNALQLASLLLNTQPDRQYIRNADGSEVYSHRDWSQMQLLKREESLQKVRDAWDETIEEIVEKSEQQEDASVRMALLHASVVRDLGKLDHASDIWDRFIQSRSGTESYIQAVITAANFLHAEGRSQQSVSLLRDAKEQEPDRFEIDGALGTIFYLTLEYEEAATYLGNAVAALNNENLYSMWIESLVFSGQFEAAELALKEFEGGDNPYGNAMLHSLISRMKSAQLLAQGDITGGSAELILYRNYLQEASNANPTLPVPYIRLAKSLLSEYRLTQNKSLLEESLQVVERGSKQIENHVQFAVIRADVLQADGQLHRAVDRLEQFLGKQPEASIVRERLVDAYLDMDDLGKAIAIANEGIELYPTDATWYLRVGNLHLRANDDRGEAVKVFMSAMKRTPNTRLLLLIDSVTRTKQMLPNRELLALVQGNFSKLHPISASIEAKVLKNLGRDRDALIAMEKSWNGFEKSIANGWLPPSSSEDWFLDLRELFDEDPNAGEALIYKLTDSSLRDHHLAGLAAYWKAFGKEYIDKAVLILEKAVVNTESGSNARVQLLTLLGSYLVDAGRFEESEKTFRQLLEEHDSPVVLNNLAYVIGMYLNKPEEGLVLSRQAVIKMPRKASFIDTMSSLHARSGDYQKAAETLEFLLQIDPARTSAMSQLAVLYCEHLGQPDRGVVYAERARSQTPRSPEVLDALGWSYYQTGRTSTGEEYLLNSLKRGETMDAYIHLAQVVMSRSEHDEALGHLRMAQELAQDDYSLNRIKVLQDDIRKAKSLSDM